MQTDRTRTTKRRGTTTASVRYAWGGLPRGAGAAAASSSLSTCIPSIMHRLDHALSGNSQSKTIRFDDRLSLERARHEPKKT